MVLSFYIPLCLHNQYKILPTLLESYLFLLEFLRLRRLQVDHISKKKSFVRGILPILATKKSKWLKLSSCLSPQVTEITSQNTLSLWTLFINLTLWWLIAEIDVSVYKGYSALFQVSSEFYERYRNVLKSYAEEKFCSLFTDDVYFKDCIWLFHLPELSWLIVADTLLCPEDLEHPSYSVLHI